VIHLRRSSQRSFAEGLMEEAVGDLWQPWMRQADRVLDDDRLLDTVCTTKSLFLCVARRFSHAALGSWFN